MTMVLEHVTKSTDFKLLTVFSQDLQLFQLIKTSPPTDINTTPNSNLSTNFLFSTIEKIDSIFINTGKSGAISAFSVILDIYLIEN